MKKLITICLVIGSILAVGANAVLADDVLPPNWRGSPGSTVQEWDFLTNANPLAPDGDLYDNPYGTPSAGLAGEGMAWYDGYWLGVEEINCGISNTLDPNLEKWIRVQITYTTDDVIPGLSWYTAPDSVNAKVGEDVFEGTLFDTIDIDRDSGYPNWWDLRVDVWDIIIPFNPEFENVIIHFPLYTSYLGDQGWCVELISW